MTWLNVLSRLSAATLLMAVSVNTGLAQTTTPVQQCDETLKRLERELAKLSKNVSQTADLKQKPPSAPAELLVELMKMEALSMHLRCLGTGPRADR